MFEPKAGYRTSEFWITVTQLIVSALVVFGVLDKPESADMTTLMGNSGYLIGPYLLAAAAVLAAGFAIAGYAIGRGSAKSRDRRA